MRISDWSSDVCSSDLALRRSLERAKRDAELDYLTGLPNRRAFELLLDRHHKEARAALEPLSVAFCDIDEFKKVNDLHGHEAGDRVIKAIADTLARISNDHCHVARHGGEEVVMRSEEHTSELQSIMRISYAVLCLKKTKSLNTLITNNY